MESREKPSILLVEDDPDTRMALADLLRGIGTHVIAVDDGQQALAALTTQKPDLVCVDLTLPEVSGFTVCAEIRKDPQMWDVPILVISARTGVDDRAHAREVGADAFLAKPFRSREFLQRVTGMLSRQMPVRSQHANEVSSG